jgi:pimeloyl-ACP methyl ester carboxylesterase
MTMRTLTTDYGRKIVLDELGDGPPLLYLHDFIDIHGATTEWQPFHRKLAERFRIIAPAHAGCNGSDEDIEASGPDDAVFHVLELLDALGLESVPVLGVGIGGWIAAELAVRDRRLVERLVLVGATGLYVPNEPTADIFFEVQPRNGTDMSLLREILFAPADAPVAHEWVPDGRLPIPRELLRYEMFRFAGRIGFKPPYLYDRQLSRRLARYDRPALVLAGERDGLVSAAHARTYADRLPDARLKIVPGAGHCVYLERGEEVANEVAAFLEPATAGSATKR